MQEESIAKSILEAVEDQSKQRGGAPITAVHVKVGPLSGVIADALKNAFEAACRKSNFPDCKLLIEEIPVTIHCPACGLDQPAVSVQQMNCSVCGAASADVVTGRELEVCAMEIIE